MQSTDNFVLSNVLCYLIYDVEIALAPQDPGPWLPTRLRDQQKAKTDGGLNEEPKGSVTKKFNQEKGEL